MLRSYARALAIMAIEGSIACGSKAPSPAAPTTVKTAVLSIVGLTATVEPLTLVPEPGLLYRLKYQVRESGGQVGATLTTQHFTLSDGRTFDGAFNPPSGPPRVLPGGTIMIESTLSIYPLTTPAGHVTFGISYTDDGGQTGSASAEADVTRVGALATLQ